MRDFEHADQQLLLTNRLLKVDVSEVIQASPASLWAIVSDHKTWPQWHDDYEQHEPITDQMTGLGTTFRSVEWWLLRSESEATRWEDGRVIGLTTRRATFWRWLVRSSYNEIEIEAVPNNPKESVVHYRAAFTGSIFFWILSGYALAHALIGLHLTAKSSLKKLAAEAGAPL